VWKHPVIKPAPLRVAAIQFLIRQFACIRLPPRFGGKTFQNARPAAFGIFKAIGM
jgi:hypothetical protein